MAFPGSTLPVTYGTHDDCSADIQSIKATLGVNPQGGLATVAARLAALPTGGTGTGTSGITPAQAGLCFLDDPQFGAAGTTDTVRMQNAMGYVGAQTYQQIIVLPHRVIDTTNVQFHPRHGTKIMSFGRAFPSGSTAGEPMCIWQTSGATALFRPPPSYPAGVSGAWQFDLEGIQFVGGPGQDFMDAEVAPNPYLSNSVWNNCGFANYNTVYHGQMQNCVMSNLNIQNCSTTALTWSGSYNYIGVGGPIVIDSLSAAGVPVLWCTNSHSTVLANCYVTTTQASTGLRFDSGDLVCSNLNFDSPTQRGTASAIYGSCVQQNGGVLSMTNTRMFGAMTAPASASDGAANHRGYVTVLGGAHSSSNLLALSGTDNARTDATPAGTPQVFVAPGASAVLGPVYAGTGGTLKLQQASAGLITALQSSAIVTAA